MRKCVCLLLSLCLFRPAHAGKLPYEGVWAGRIGSHPVQVCFSSADSSYYYLNRTTGIVLSLDEEQAPFIKWRESGSRLFSATVTGSWTIREWTDRTLEGSWTDLAGSKSLPVSLSKVARLVEGEKYGPCGEAYFRPVEKAAAITGDKQQIASKFGKAYQLPASYAGAAGYNAGVRDWLNRQAVEAYECLVNGGQRDWDAEVEKKLLNGSVLVVREQLFDIFCGGNHSNSLTAYRSYDPRTGKAIDTWTWVNDGAVLSERLRALIEKRHMKDSDKQCAAGFSIEPPYPGASGLTFPVNYLWALRACDNEVEVLYKDLKPYLTRAGRDIANSFARP